MAISDIQRLREATGAGVMECKKALQDSGGDFDKAKDLINERGLVKAEKKGDRQTGAGLLESYIHNGRVGVLLELRCETDFVARSEPMKELSHNLVMHIAAMDPENIESLLTQLYVKDESQTVDNLIKQAVAKLGENLKVARFARYEL
ncbi:MAG: elongation factor T [Parcubacteria group bacterium Athens0714_26]|nr:MAG: elongation factor T [Parcubacteria group bacterium Athens1014_26]TSD03255.1 MAG: elongation factor T [Parcubacteria group bacterium Athens0714_26]